jgi:hypothetical protein
MSVRELNKIFEEDSLPQKILQTFQKTNIIRRINYRHTS